MSSQKDSDSLNADTNSLSTKVDTSLPPRSWVFTFTIWRILTLLPSPPPLIHNCTSLSSTSQCLLCWSCLFPVEGHVVQSNSWIHMINLQTRTCFCCCYQKNDILCGHAMACIFALRQSLEAYLSFILSVAVWTATYVEAMPAVNVSNLRFVSMKCNPSHTHVPCERPRKKQIRVKNTRAPQGLHQKNMREDEGVLRQNAVLHRCSTCHEVGHNASTCCRPHN